jgi:hypothetical protein
MVCHHLFILFCFSELIWVWISSSEDHIDINFSNLQYEDVTPFVGLEPDERMDDIEIFRLHRSRISTALFKQIVQDIEIMSIQYGPPFKHETEEATLRFISPVSVSHFLTSNVLIPFTLRSSIILLPYLALHSEIELNQLLRAILLGWSITSLAQQSILLQFFL